MADRNAVFPANPHALFKLHRYSPAIRSGDLLFVSGMVGARADGSPEPDTKEQVRLAFRNLNGVLEAAGASFDDVVDVTLFIVDPETNFGAIFEVLPEFWGEEPYPNVTAAGVTWLAGFLFEIKVVARIPAGETNG
jgi:enamine deaminase RidA (YjgF/YER057c/UK114 family)